MAQTLVCSKHHSSEQQLLRWMLTTLDRSLSLQINTTQQEIANLLGFRREVVSLILGRLQLQEDIQLRRGKILVLNRPALEKAVCDCYRVWQCLILDSVKVTNLENLATVGRVENA
jgi:DNA-binding transcriptional regulator LsrR (DeoR family)